jgi:hypothetical protein
VIQGDFQAPNWLDLQRLHHNHRSHDDRQLLPRGAEATTAGAQTDLRLPGDVAHRLRQPFQPGSQGLADPGDWRVYSWGMGELAPQPLECAFLALNYWAFRQIEGGRSASDVIKDIVEGNESYAVLGIAIMLALETWEITETTLAVASCQRLWQHDIARMVQEPTKNIDLFGFGFLSRLTGEKASAKEFLDQRKSRAREIRQLALLFALNENSTLSGRFNDALAHFPDELPYEYEEQKTDGDSTARLKEAAERWAGLGDRKNYKQTKYDETHVAITYEAPRPLSDNEQKRLTESTTSLQRMNIVRHPDMTMPLQPQANLVRAGMRKHRSFKSDWRTPQIGPFADL